LLADRWALAGARVRLRALAADRKPSPVADTAVAADFHKALYIQGNLSAKIAFDLEVVVDIVAKFGNFGFG
jgi:hypothetical protein